MKLWHRFRHAEDGSIAVETALIMVIIASLALSILDYGMLYARNLQLANAARAGMQYALVRKPVDGDYSAIVNAVQAAAPAANANGDRVVSTAMYCRCPDGTAIDCTGEFGQDLTCADGSLRASYLEIGISETHSLMFPYPGLSQDLSLSESVTVRLN